MYDIDTTEVMLSFSGNYIPSKFVCTSDDRLLYVGYAVDCLFKVRTPPPRRPQIAQSRCILSLRNSKLPCAVWLRSFVLEIQKHRNQSHELSRGEALWTKS